MSPPARNVRCSQITRAGKPCKAWALPNTDPPLCFAHSGQAGAPPANQNAAQHGFYSSVLRPEELADLVTYADDLSLDDEIACARVALRRILTLLNADSLATFEDPDQKTTLSTEDYCRLAGLALQGVRTIARLLRDKRALSGDAADGLVGAIGTALTEIGTELGIDL